MTEAEYRRAVKSSDLRPEWARTRRCGRTDASVALMLAALAVLVYTLAFVELVHGLS